MFVTSKLLALRRSDPDLFARGNYVPLQVDGERKEHVLAFARVLDTHACVVVVPRWSATLLRGVPDLPIGAVWGDTSIQLGEGMTGPLTELFTARTVESRESTAARSLSVADVLGRIPGRRAHGLEARTNSRATRPAGPPPR